MRILVVGLNYAPEPVGIGPYTAGLAEGLVARGHRVEVVTGRSYYPQWAPLPGYPARWNRRTQGGVGITRVPHYIPRDPGGLKRLIHLASFTLSALFPAVKQARRMKPDHVLVVAPSLLAMPVGAMAARFSGAKLWVHVQDFELEAAQATGLLSGKGAVARLGRAVERFLFGLADFASTISPAMCTRLEAKGFDARDTFEMRNWANHADTIMAAGGGTSGASPYVRAWGLEGRKVLLYSGNIANKQGLDVVIDAARLLSDRGDLAFVICGEGPNRQKLEAQAEGLANIQFHDLQPREKVGDLLALAHAHLLPQKAGAADLVLPSKLTNILASGRPVIATAEAGTGLAEECEGCGIVTMPEDARALANAIERLADDEPLADRLGAEALLRARERWALDGILNSTEAELIARRPARPAT
ncbi:WcaI family glycosyltransferase [Croceicoccus sp. 1NDH52]|nr:WcaI family glycosyltransferase [Croceicoccus gelatinilyticus]